MHPLPFPTPRTPAAPTPLRTCAGWLPWLSPLLALMLLEPVAGCAPTDDSGSAADADTDTDTDTDTGSNQPPTAPVVSLQPVAPSGLVDLVSQIDVASNDPESQAVTYTYAWAVDGAARPDLTGSSVSSTELLEASVWSVTVTPNDGAQDGESGTASATVRNDAPSVLAHLEPLAPVPYDTITFVYDTEPTDPNGDAVTTTLKWYKNGTYHLDWDGLLSLDPLQVRGGDEFVAEYSTTDGRATTDLQHARVTVANTAPEITSATLSPLSATDGDDIKVKVVATDADDNDLTYSYVWYRNGAAATDVGDSDTVPAAATEVDDAWYCDATVFDGTDSVTAPTETLTVIPWQGSHQIYTFSATIPSGAATSSGTWAIQYLTHGDADGENNCDLHWSFSGVEDKPLCRGCEFRFDTTLTYDPTASTVTTGCDTAQVSGTGAWTYDLDGTNFYAQMTGPVFDSSSYSTSPIRMSVVGSGGTTRSDTASTNYQYYSLTSTEDSAGNTQFTAYLNYANFTY